MKNYFQHELSQASAEHLDVLRRFYNDDHRGLTKWGVRYRQVLASYYRQIIPSDASVLEIGCGDGTLLAMLPGRDKTGVDLSESQIAKARRRLPEATFFVEAGESFRPGKIYDYIVISDTLNESADCQLLLQRLLAGAGAHTRLVLNFFNSLWKPLLDGARALGAASPVPEPNWLTRLDVINFLELSGWEKLRASNHILIPHPESLAADLANRWMTPLLSGLALAEFLIARKRCEPELPVPGAPASGSISIIVPARNEAGNVEAAVRRVPEMSPDQEWIFVEGGSKDNTWEVLQTLPALYPGKKITVIRQTGKGKANAVREGFARASGDILMILDADLTMPPEELPKYYEVIVNGTAELANGVRLIYPMDKKAMQFLNLCVNRFFAVLFSWILGQAVKDTLCGTKVLSKRNYERIAQQRAYFGDFDPFGDFEILFGAAKINLRIRDIPIRYKERTYGTTNISRWVHGMILLRMAAIGALKLKFCRIGPPSQSATPTRPLDRRLPMMLRICLLIIMGLIPSWYVAKHYDQKTGFTSLILFGKEFAPRQLPEVKQLHVATDSPFGYDAQFYAQIAVDPSLRNPALRKACDLPGFRSQRILAPLLAFGLGLGRPSLVVEIYALLNLVFWFLLLGGLLYGLRAVSTRHYLCISAILFSTGSLISIQRALSDLPMATLAFYAAMLSGVSSALLICLSILTKPTAGLLLLKYIWPLPQSGKDLRTRILYISLALAVPILWVFYIRHVFGTFGGSGGNFNWPFKDWALAVERTFEAWRSTPYKLIWKEVSNWEWRLFELLAPLSLMFQVFYLAIRRNLASAYWWMGIGFAALFVCLSSSSFAEQIAISRDVLPMTIAFNIQLLQQKGRGYLFCFLFGNVGLLWALHDTLSFCLG